MNRDLNKTLIDLINYCEDEEFKGYDPYDGLESKFFQSLPFLRKNHIARLIWIQLFKRSPINLRNFFGVEKAYNPKALGLFLSGYCALYKRNKCNNYLNKIYFLIEKIMEVTSTGYSGACWGYNFDWESKAFYLPKYTPTIVVSSFIANALLDAYELISDEKLLITARSTCEFILKDINRTYNKNGDYAFSYSRFDNSVVYNASFLGSKLLARLSYFTSEQILFLEAKKVVKFCCQAQEKDGSWKYGTHTFHQWKDNFHTGYNVECLSDYINYSNDHQFDSNLNKGFNYYINTFFDENGISKYYHNSIYPIDIHSPAQLIITLSSLNKLNDHNSLAKKILNWTITYMHSKKGYFYYQKNKHFINKIPYMRWSQAWMFYALSKYILNTNESNLVFSK